MLAGAPGSGAVHAPLTEHSSGSEHATSASLPSAERPTRCAVLALALKSNDPGMVDAVREAGVVPSLRDVAYASDLQDATLARRILELGRPQVGPCCGPRCRALT